MKFYNDEFTVLAYEFKVQIAQYLAGLSNTTMQYTVDLITFDTAHCEEEEILAREVFDASEDTSGNLNDPVYLSARAIT
jgi:hypothetical protein